jgi:chemotaxis-related protein WspB
MLLLLFQLGDDRYALDARQVAEVLPLVTITRIPHAPPGVAGVFNYRGAPVPAIDLSQLTIGRPAHARLSTRLVVVHYPDGSGNTRLLGLVAEKATGTVRRELGDFVASGVTNPETAHVGSVATDAGGLTHWIDLQKLLPESVRGVLFQNGPGS